MTILEIRAVCADDVAQWQPLWKGYQNFYRIEIPSQTTALTWQRFLDVDQPIHAALAWSGDRAVGLVHWVYHRSTWTEGQYCYLQDLFVSPRMRGKSIGRKLIETVYEQARAGGCARVYWLTHESNQDAMHLYDRVANKSGFIQYRKAL